MYHLVHRPSVPRNGRRVRVSAAQRVVELQRKIGQQTLKLDFFARALGDFGLRRHEVAWRMNTIDHLVAGLWDWGTSGRFPNMSSNGSTTRPDRMPALITREAASSSRTPFSSGLRRPESDG